MIADQDLPEFLASWVRRYPFTEEWCDDATNAACRESQARWFAVLREGSPDSAKLSALVQWKFNAQQRAKPLQALSPARWPTTECLINTALGQVGERVDDDLAPLVTLDEIYGWGIPMASALLAVRYPDRFTIADGRARTVLRRTRGFPDNGKWTFVQSDWIPYLVECRKVLSICQHSPIQPPYSDKWTLRQVDQALWAAYETVKLGREDLAKPVSCQTEGTCKYSDQSWSRCSFWSGSRSVFSSSAASLRQRCLVILHYSGWRR